MKKLTVRLDDKVSEALTRLAQAHQRSVNRQVVWLIEQAISENTHNATDKTRSKAKQQTKKGRDISRPNAGAGEET